MTRWVQMLVGVSGGRHDDRPWPPAFGLIDVPDWEAEHLVAGGNALYASPPAPAAPAPPPSVPVPEPEPEPAPVAPPYVSPVAQASPVAEVPAAAQAAEPESGSAAEPEETGPPAPSAPKQAWIDWAVAQGADPGMASGMTKADLMSRYGGRLLAVSRPAVWRCGFCGSEAEGTGPPPDACATCGGYQWEEMPRGEGGFGDHFRPPPG